MVLNGWLVVLTILKNISQLGWLLKNHPNVPNHQPVMGFKQQKSR
jgi:hypothetical protein